VTAEKEPPISGHPVNLRLARKDDHSKPCTLLTVDLTGMETEIGYNVIDVATKTPVSLEKVELEVKRICICVIRKKRFCLNTCQWR
jgi:hypothetical protein